MRIFRDPSLAVHHGMVIQAIMFIFKSLGLRCVPYLNRVVPYMIYTIRNCGTPNLRESLLQQLATLSLIVREHLRPFVADISDVVEYFWSSRHLATIFTLVSNLAIGVPEGTHGSSKDTIFVLIHLSLMLDITSQTSLLFTSFIC